MSAFAKIPVSGPGARSWLDRLARQPHPEEDRPDRALPPAVAERRRALRIHRLSNGARDASTSSAPAPSSGMTTTISQARPPTARCVLHRQVTTQIRRAGARRPALARAAAEAHRCRSLERGLPVALRQGSSTSAPPRPMRCGSTSSASSAGSCTIRSRCRPPSSTCSWTPASRFGIRPFGIKAMDSLRSRRSTGSSRANCRSNIRPTNPASTASSIPNKGEFIGRDALVRWRERGFRNRFVTLEVARREGCRRPRLRADLRKKGALVGRCTSGGFGWRVGKSLALAMVSPISASSAANSACAYSARPTPRPSSRSRHTIRRT